MFYREIPGHNRVTCPKNPANGERHDKMSEEGPVLNQIMPHRHKILYLRLMYELNEKGNSGLKRMKKAISKKMAMDSKTKLYIRCTAAPKCTSEARRKRSREKAYAADRTQNIILVRCIKRKGASSRKDHGKPIGRDKWRPNGGQSEQNGPGEHDLVLEEIRRGESYSQV
ncbi:hypothetical protein OROMI_016789 [Orobanche minor]